MFGNISPFFTIWGPATATQGGILTTSDQVMGDGIKTFKKGIVVTAAAQAGVQEPLFTGSVTDDATARFYIDNDSTSDTVFRARVRGVGASNLTALVVQAEGTTDSSTAALLRYTFRTVAGAQITNRPFVDWQNFGTSVLQMIPINSGAGAALSWGTSMGAGSGPAVTTRSVGTGIVLYNALSGTVVDNAIGTRATGAVQWYSVPNNGNSFEWYGGTVKCMSLRGDGLLTTLAGKVRKTRIALTTPVTVATTDDIVEINLTTPGAVTINYPATPTTGTEFVFQDGKGDAGANNHTHTPAAGNINGAGTKVYAANYYRATAFYNGTQWLIG